jgi:hypothetical protein
MSKPDLWLSELNSLWALEKLFGAGKKLIELC